MRSDVAILSIVGLLVIGSSVRAADTLDPLAWPPITRECKPWSRWWWLGSAVDKENLTRLLEQYHDAGIGGLEICPIYGAKGYEDRYIDFLSPKWMEMLAHTTREAQRLGLGVDLTTGTGWPFGGPWVLNDHASAKVVFNGHDVHEVAPIQKVKRAAPGGEGNVLDPYSVAAMESYLARFDEAFARFDAPMPRSQFHDSFEYYGANWTSDFFEQFSRRRGYDLHTQLPALNGEGDRDIVARVRCDYRETISELHLAYIDRWTQWSHEHHSLSRNQAHGAPGNLIDLYAAADIAETEIFGEVNEKNIAMHKLASSAAHLAGRNLTSSESFTWLGEHFCVSLADVKPAADFLFLCGINHIFFHGIPYSPQDVPWPGWLFYAAVNFGPNGGLWRGLPAFNAYVARVQSILQSGRPDNDVLLYWPIYDTWQTAEGAAPGLMQFTVHDQPKWLWPTPFYAAAIELWKRGYSFDAVSDRLLANAKCIDGRVRLGGSCYRVIVIPKCRLIPVATMRKLIELSSGGATVIVQDALPQDVPGLADLEQRRAEFRKLNASTLHVTVDLEASLTLAKVPRETMVERGLQFVRRRRDDGRDYFIVNRGDNAIDGWVTLAAPAASAVLLDPRFEARSGVAAIHDDQIYLQLQPGESIIVRTFDQSLRAARWAYVAVAGESVNVSGTWRVQFVDGGPQLPADFQTTELASWTTLGDAEAKRFSGTARYSIEFDRPIAKADDWLLNLGRVCESDRVRLNGRDVGTLFCRPFSIHVAEFLQDGRNLLEVEVTNLAANRIADLDRRGVNWKSFHEINFVNKDYKPFDASHWPLRDSGLLGPVRLTPLRQIDPASAK